MTAFYRDVFAWKLQMPRADSNHPVLASSLDGGIA